jgi:hypothetical protein
MDPSTEPEATHDEIEPSEGASPARADEPAAEDEFRLTIRKLEMPVRPRGVLAE